MNVPTGKQARRTAIEDAAYRVLVRDGYKATSILAVAKEAKASNETLYRWYGNKQALFASLVERNAEGAREALSAALKEGSEPVSTLRAIGPVLLTLVTSERAVALNRAAAGDVYDTGQLGEALAKGGRNTVVPLIAKVLEQAQSTGAFEGESCEEAADVYISLLLGDVQIRRAIGALAELSQDEIKQHADRALELFVRLYRLDG